MEESKETNANKKEQTAEQGIASRDSDFNLKSGRTVVFQPNHSLMARPRKRNIDLQPQRVFFYLRITDQVTLHYTEQEAAMMMKSSHAPFLKQIGVSDGSAYAEHIRGCGIKPGQTIPKEDAEDILRDAMKAEIESAKGKYANPISEHVHFEGKFPLHMRRDFQPPAD